MARIKVNPTHVRKAMAHPVCAKLILNFSHRIRPQADCRTVQIRAVMTPGLESAPESDFGSFWTSDYVDSGSGSFSLESPESAPLVVLNISGAYYDRQKELPVISYFNAQNMTFFSEFDKYCVKLHCLDHCPFFYGQIYLGSRFHPWSRFQPWIRFHSWS